MAMASGFVSGLVRGSLLSIVVLGAMSLVAPLPERPGAAPPQDRLDLPAGSEFRRPPPESDTVLPEPDETPAAAAGTRPAADAGPTDSEPPAETTPPPRPAVADAPPPGAPPPDTGETGAGERLPAASAEAPPAGSRPEAIGVPVPAIPVPRIQFDESRLPQVTPPAPADAAPADAQPIGVGGLPSDIAPAAPGDTTGDIASPDAAAAAPPGATEVQPSGPRLPTVADVTEPSLPGVRATGPVSPPQAEDAGPRLGALARNAAGFEAGDGRPLMAILLIDAGETGLDPEVLATFSFPVTFAIDPAAPGAGERAARLRGAGFEVVALLPEGDAGLAPEAAPADVETALASYFDTLPQAVALFDPREDAVRAVGGAAARQMLAFLGDSGHGLLTRNAGLNSLPQAARRAGLPAATVFRDLDAAREDAPVIRRYLDRAAFRARSEGSVIVLGHTYPETVRALFEWAMMGEAETVRLAPVSAVLRLLRRDAAQ